MTIPRKTPLPRESAKHRAQREAAGRPFGPKRSSKPKARNAKRAKANHDRAYGGEGYLAWIQSLPCAACGYAAEKSDAAHVRTGGLSRKADAEWLVPLCKPHLVIATWGKARLYEGCHRASHRGQRTFEKDSGLDLKALAQSLWRDYHAATDALARSAEANSYGVKCAGCGQWETACTCEAA